MFTSSDHMTNNPEAIKFLSYRTKTKKWGTYLLYVGYLLIFLNVLALVISISKIVGLIDETGIDYVPEKDTLMQEIESKQSSGEDLTLEDKQIYSEEQVIQERKKKFHSIILTKRQ